MSAEKLEELKQMFSREYEVLEKGKELLEKENPSNEELKNGLEDMVKYFNRLLKDSMKMT